jgi:NADH-quinone oxidoreductase subunit J
MNLVFYLSALVAIVSTIFVITQLNAVHALLYLIVSLLAVAMIFFTLGAPFVAALEVIVYAGAIMVLFVFVMMTLNLGPQTVSQERAWLNPKTWFGPSVLALVLLIELAAALATNGGTANVGASAIDPRQVGIALFGPYVLGVELASFVLLSGLIGAYHLGQRDRRKETKVEAIRQSEVTQAQGPEPAQASQLQKEVEHVR